MLTSVIFLWPMLGEIETKLCCKSEKGAEEGIFA
jgi:hypothetical protein